MTLSLYLQCIGMFVLGQGLHLFWNKIPSFKKRAAAANKPYSFKEMWSCDKHIVYGLQLFAASIFVGLDQLIHYKPELIEWTKWFFWLIGAYGSSVAFQKFSQYDKMLTDILDKKANISDIITGGTTTVKDTIEKGNEATGKDVTKHIQ